MFYWNKGKGRASGVYIIWPARMVNNNIRLWFYSLVILEPYKFGNEFSCFLHYYPGSHMSLVVSLNDFRLVFGKLSQLNVLALSNSASTEENTLHSWFWHSSFKVRLHCLNHCKEYSGPNSSFLDATTDFACLHFKSISKGLKTFWSISFLVQKISINTWNQHKNAPSDIAS